MMARRLLVLLVLALLVGLSGCATTGYYGSGFYGDYDWPYYYNDQPYGFWGEPYLGGPGGEFGHFEGHGGFDHDRFGGEHHEGGLEGSRGFHGGEFHGGGEHMGGFHGGGHGGGFHGGGHH